MKSICLRVLVALFFVPGVAMAQDAAQLSEITAEEARIPKPPRSVSDVLRMLDQHQADPKRIQALTKEADASPPSGMSERDLCLFYQNRSLAAATLGRLDQSEEDSKKAIEFTPLNDKNLIGDSYSAAASAAMSAGHPDRAIK